MRALGLPKPCVGVLHLVGVAWALATGSFAAAEDPRLGHADLARELVEAVSAEPGGASLDAWSRAVIDHALGQAVGTASPPGFPPHAGANEARGSATAEVLLFTSLSVPVASWRALARDAARIGAPLVLRGVTAGGLPNTARQIAGRLGEAKVGVSIDPRLFRLFRITRVPVVVVVPGGVPPCRSRGCADDEPPPFDRVSGNLSLAAALEAIAAEGDTGRSAARRHLATLRGTTP